MSALDQPPPSPEQPARFEGWPAWYAPLGFLVAIGFGLVTAAIAVTVLLFVSGAELPEDDPTLTIVGTVIQDGAFVVAAILLAWLTTRPRAWHFGLTRARAWPTIGWTTLAFVAFLGFSFVYPMIIGEPSEQTTLDDLGAREGTFGMVLAGLLVIVVAPFVEEFFFRGFFYGSLRTSLPIWAAAAITGALFGVIHLPTGPEAVPILVVLGVIFCLLYERTGTLYSAIALHVAVNSFAFGAAVDPLLAAAIGGATLGACLLLPLLSRGRRSPLPSARAKIA